MRIKIDREACVGQGDCAVYAKGVFQVADDNIAIVLDPTAASAEDIIEAARMCPSQCISLWDDEGNKVYPDYM